MQFQIRFRWESRKRDTCVIEIKVYRKHLNKQIRLTRSRSYTSGLLNNGGTTDLTMLRTLVAIRQMLPELSF